VGLHGLIAAREPADGKVGFQLPVQVDQVLCEHEAGNN
jgi:hypothetical protein